ncbi:MAG: acetate kinase, partial [Thermoproteales archaeon]|nr:acetate kinase [Thermoproteales archaeon]
GRVRDHEEAFREALRCLMDPEKGVIKDPSEVRGVGHRVVHGGEKYAKPVVIDEDVMRTIEELSILAPLHNPANLAGIRGAMKAFKDAVHVAVFDTAFHATLPEEAYLYAIPYELYEKYRIRRYGFHGISHEYVARRAAEILGRPLEELRIITLHLGNGASAAAVKYGKSVDTSMGLTPLEGLVMGTRSGDIDPAIFYFLMKQEGMSADEVYELLNKRSGLLGLSGVSNDVRLIWEEFKKGNRRAELAFRVFAYRIKKYIGAYAAAMGGVDAIVFTAGIGEKSSEVSSYIRRLVCEGLEFLGVKLDEERNRDPEKYGYVISSDDSRVKVLAIPTNEELLMAREVYRILQRGSC